MSYKKSFSSGTDVELLSRSTEFHSFLQIDDLQLKHRLFEGGWSETISRELLVKTPAVGVLLYDSDRFEFVMVRQFRVGMLDREESPWPLELIAGLVDVDKDETLESVAQREVKEETNLEVSEIIKICDYYNSPGASSEQVTLFFARVDASSAGGVYGLDHEHEDIQVEVISEQEAHQAMQIGAINNAMSLIALQWFFLNRDSILGAGV